MAGLGAADEATVPQTGGVLENGMMIDSDSQGLLTRVKLRLAPGASETTGTPAP